MASYLPGMTDHFTPQDLFKPNYGLMGQAAGTLLNRYNQGFQSLKNVYSSLLNAPLSSQDNIKFRDEYFKKVDAEFQRLSQTDLSKQENVSKATSLFDPLINDKELISDMSKTRFYQNEMAAIDSVKNSFDDNVRKKYHPDAEKYVLNEYQKLRESKRGDGSISSVQSRKYTPYEDVMEFLGKAAKDEGLKISRDELSGFYKISHTNGAAAAESFEEWARARMGNRFDEQFRISGQVQSEDFFKSTTAQGLTKEQAAKAFVEQYKLPLQVDFEREMKGLEIQKANAQHLLDEIKRKGNGMVHKSQIPVVKQLKALLTNTDEAIQTLRRDKPNVEAYLQNNLNRVMNDPGGLLRETLKRRSSAQWASTYAKATETTEIEEDKVKMTEFVQQQENARLGTRLAHEARMQQRAQDHDLNMLKTRTGLERQTEFAKIMLKAELEGGGSGSGAGGSAVLGPEVLSGNRTLAQAQDIHLAELESNSSRNLHSREAITVAAHLDRNADGSFGGSISPTRIGDLLNKAKQSQYGRTGGLTAGERNELTAYLQRIDPTYSFKNYDTALLMMKNGVAKYSTRPEFGDGTGAKAAAAFSQGLSAMGEYAKTMATNQNFLRRMYNQGPEYAEKIGVRNGFLYIKDPTDPVSSQWVANKEVLKHYTQSSKQSIQINSPTEKTDPVFVNGLVGLMANVGQVDDKGNYHAFNGDSFSDIRRLSGTGIDNLSKILDTQGAKMYEQIDDKGRKYVQVEVGVKRNSDGSRSMIEDYVNNKDVKKQVGNTNKLVFRIDAANIARMTQGNRTINIPGLGSMQLPNNFAKYINAFSEGRHLNINSLSGVANLRPGQSMPLPLHFDSYNTKGTIMVDQNGEIVTRLNVGGEVSEVPTNFTIDDVRRNPDTIPKQLEQTIIKFAQYMHGENTKQETVKKHRTQQQQHNKPKDYVSFSSL